MTRVIATDNSRPSFPRFGTAISPAPVVLIHSLGGSPRHWSKVADLLRGHHRHVVTPWLPGHPGGPLPPDFEVVTLTSVVLHELDRLTLPRYVIVGHSIGAFVAVAAAHLAPHRIRGLVMVDPGPDPRGYPYEQEQEFLEVLHTSAYSAIVTEYWQRMLSRSHPGTAEVVIQDLTATPRETIMAVFDALRRFDPVYSLKTYQGPALSIESDAGYSRSEASLVPGIRRARMSGTGHWPHLDRPDLFSLYLRRFVERVELLDPYAYLPYD